LGELIELAAIVIEDTKCNKCTVRFQTNTHLQQSNEREKFDF